MKGHAVSILIAILICALLAGSVLAQSGNGRSVSIPFTAGQETLSGGSYHLTSLVWKVSGTVSGGKYSLLSPDSPALRGNGCCCMWLPYVERHH